MTESNSTIVFLSTYPPRECGIATFTQDLLYFSQKLLGTSVHCKVAALNLSPLDTYKYPPKVEWEIDQNNRKEFIQFAHTVNNDASILGVIVQHEYGIFGGVWGEKLVSFMRNCKKPMLVTLHTVLPSPTPKMKEITEHIIKLATTLVVLTENSKKIIEEVYPESMGKIFVIPHGIHDSQFSDPEKYKVRLELKNHTILSTFGLLSRSKGIEYVIKALPAVIKKYPSVLYLILGETHPVIRRREGEKYRIELAQLIKKLGLKKHVKFYDQYMSLSHLTEFLKATDIYIATSTNPNQAVSGTFSYALGVGRAVVSTEFAQAKEIITPEVGRLVPIKNSPAITAALLDLLSNIDQLKEMNLNAYEKTRPMLWTNVAEWYAKLLTRTILPPLKLTHLRAMTDDFGFFQFATGSIPNKDYGYTVDDNARALIVCSLLVKKNYKEDLHSLINIYLEYLQKCQRTDGSFTNYIGFTDKMPTKQNDIENLQDVQGRALWALGEVMSNSMLANNIRAAAKKMFLLALPKVSDLTYARSRAFVIKACALAREALPEYQQELTVSIKTHADYLLSALSTHSVESWTWFEDYLSYNNAILPESLLIAGVVTKNPHYTEKGIQALDFLISKTFSSSMYQPIGHAKWYKRNGERSYYDQQAEDPAATILALVTAYKITHNDTYRKLVDTCFSWFLGNNSLHIPLYNEKTGGCFDGLRPDGVNGNQGAESLVSYLMSRIVIIEIHNHEDSSNQTYFPQYRSSSV